MRALRLEKNLSQEGLAALCPPTKDRSGNVVPHGNSWISNIERDIYEPSLEDLAALATALDVDLRWLVTGEASGMSEFVARMSEMETQLDGRAVRQILAITRQIIEELRDYPQ